MFPPDQKKVKEIALEFLALYHDASTVESAHLEDGVWVVLAKVGQITQQIKKIIIDAKTGQILSYTDRRLSNDRYGLKQAHVAQAVEKILLKIGTPVYEAVIQKLYEDYHCDLFDCYENPEYLNSVIKEILGENYVSVVELIKSQLHNDNEQKTVDFLAVISR